MSEPLIVILAVFFLITLLFIVTIKKSLYICKKNEVLIITTSGNTGINNTIGYRVVKKGMVYKIPFLQKVYKMTLLNTLIKINTDYFFSQEKILVKSSITTNIKTIDTEAYIHNAIERFLDTPKGKIIKISQEIIKANFKFILESITLEELNKNKAVLFQEIEYNINEDLSKLGLELNNFEINITS